MGDVGVGRGLSSSASVTTSIKVTVSMSTQVVTGLISNRRWQPSCDGTQKSEIRLFFFRLEMCNENTSAI